MMVPSAGGVERSVTTMSVPDPRNRWRRGLAWSSDGRWIALGGQPSATDSQGIWLMAADGKTRRALTNAPGDARDERPVFSADGTRLAFLRRYPVASLHYSSGGVMSRRGRRSWPWAAS